VFGAEVEWMPKRLWIEMVNGGRFPRSELRDYYDRCIRINGERIRDLLDVDPESVIDVPAVGKLFATLDAR